MFGYESDIERTDVLYTSLVVALVPDRARPRAWGGRGCWGFPPR
jgi:hypothetical protein